MASRRWLANDRRISGLWCMAPATSTLAAIGAVAMGAAPASRPRRRGSTPPVAALPDSTPWPNRHPRTSSTSRCRGSRLPSPGRAGDAPLPAPVAIAPPASRARSWKSLPKGSHLMVPSEPGAPTKKAGGCPGLSSSVTGHQVRHRVAQAMALSFSPSRSVPPSPRISILRGFMASGISRRSSMWRSPFSSRASTTRT